MAIRSLIAFAVLVSVQALSGCDMPGKSGVTRDNHSSSRKMDVEVRDARLRRQVEAGTFGLAQLYPAGTPIEARHLPPLPRPVAVRIPAVPVRVAQATEPVAPMNAAPVNLAFASAARQSDGCVYKPVMSDADISACN